MPRMTAAKARAAGFAASGALLLFHYLARPLGLDTAPAEVQLAAQAALAGLLSAGAAWLIPNRPKGRGL